MTKTTTRKTAGRRSIEEKDYKNFSNPVPYVLKWFLLTRPHKTIRPYEPMKMPEKEIELIIKTFNNGKI